MLHYSEEMEFEKAALIHNRSLQLEKLQRQARKYQRNLDGRDYCVFLRAWREDCFYLVYVHDGIALVKLQMKLVPELDRSMLEYFREMVFSGTANIADGTMFTTCLVNISADKLYLDMTSTVSRKNETLFVNKIICGYEEFTKSES